MPTNDFELTVPDLYFQDLYRKLLEAESDGILHDVDMLEVEKLILDPKGEMESVGCPCDVDEEEENKRRKIDTESGGILHVVNTEEAENLIPDPKTEVKAVGLSHDADEDKENRTKNDSSLL